LQSDTIIMNKTQLMTRNNYKQTELYRYQSYQFSQVINITKLSISQDAQINN